MCSWLVWRLVVELACHPEFLILKLAFWPPDRVLFQASRRHSKTVHTVCMHVITLKSIKMTFIQAHKHVGNRSCNNIVWEDPEVGLSARGILIFRLGRNGFYSLYLPCPVCIRKPTASRLIGVQHVLSFYFKQVTFAYKSSSCISLSYGFIHSHFMWCLFNEETLDLLQLWLLTYY